MMMRISLAAALLALSACASGGVGRGPDPEMAAAYRGTQAPSIYGLIGARERLGLTSIQVTTLDSIAESLRARNTRLSDSLRAIRDVGPGGPIPPPRDSAERAGFVPVLQQMARNNQASLAAVQALLTEEQRRLVCQLLPGTPGRPGRPGERSVMVRGDPGSPANRERIRSELAGEDPTSGRSWPWCAGPVRTDSVARS